MIMLDLLLKETSGENGPSTKVFRAQTSAVNERRERHDDDVTRDTRTSHFGKCRVHAPMPMPPPAYFCYVALNFAYFFILFSSFDSSLKYLSIDIYFAL